MNGESKTRVNLGCGNRFHPAWINIDMSAQAAGVVKADLSKGIPLADSSCDVVYHAAVLEHIRRADAPAFLEECLRVLRPGGMIRVGVPDLEGICREYLRSLEEAVAGTTDAEHDYDWMLLELLDQMVRENAGGAMLDYLSQRQIPNEPFVLARIGEEGRELIDTLREASIAGTPPAKPSLMHEIRWRVRESLADARRAKTAFLLGRGNRQALAIGQFRLAGEAHHWMYDRFSLARILTQAGFHETVLRDAHSSGIPEWNTFHLDILPDGRVTKPDLFFMEAIKPRALS